MKTALIALALLAAPGCATLREHPRLVAVGVAVVGTSIALSTQRHHGGGPPQPAYTMRCYEVSGWQACE